MGEPDASGLASFGAIATRPNLPRLAALAGAWINVAWTTAAQHTYPNTYPLAAGTTYFDWLEDVSLDGATTRHEPVSVTYTGSPTAVSLGRFGASPALPALPIAAVLLMTALAAGAAATRRRVTSNKE